MCWMKGGMAPTNAMMMATESALMDLVFAMREKTQPSTATATRMRQMTTQISRGAVVRARAACAWTAGVMAWKRVNRRNVGQDKPTVRMQSLHGEAGDELTRRSYLGGLEDDGGMCEVEAGRPESRQRCTDGTRTTGPRRDGRGARTGGWRRRSATKGGEKIRWCLVADAATLFVS